MNEQENVEVTKEKPKRIWSRKNIHLVDEEHDIKFRGPLSYRHLRIFGWIFLALAQIGILLSLSNTLKVANINEFAIEAIKSAGSLMTPLFLFAAFAQVLVAKDGYKRLLFTYISGAVGIYTLFLVVYLHFGVGLMHAFTNDWKQAFDTCDAFVSALGSSGAFSFNIFIDLILCTLVTFLLNYHPTKHFQGKKIYLFRALVALPIIYEIGSIVLKILGSSDIITISPFLIPLLTTKPPVAFLIFIVLALFVKNRERYYIKKGKTHSDYKKFLNTNVNRLHFSLFLVGSIVVAVIIDFILAAVIYGIKDFALIQVEAGTKTMEEISTEALSSTLALGFGGCFPMVLIIPLLIFFDYTKIYKNKVIDVIIPVAGVVLIVLIYIEGLFQILSTYMLNLIKKQEEDPDAGKETEAIFSAIKRLFKL